MTGIAIRAVAPADLAAWEALYAGYARFYRKGQTPAMRARVWGWLMDQGHAVEGRIATLDGRPVGLAHFRAFARPLDASTGGFLDDLYVDPAARGAGVGRALIEAVAAEGRARGWSVIRWITAADNAAARALYDRLAAAGDWVTYDMAP